jgi:hypothetical protein
MGIDVQEKFGEAVDVSGKRRGSAIGLVRRLAIGKFSLDNMAVTVETFEPWNARRKRDEAPEIQGVVSTEFLACGHGVIDCANLRLYLLPAR